MYQSAFSFLKKVSRAISDLAWNTWEVEYWQQDILQIADSQHIFEQMDMF